MAGIGAFRPLLVPGRTAAVHLLCSRSPRGGMTPLGDLCTGYAVADMTESFELWP